MENKNLTNARSVGVKKTVKNALQIVTNITKENEKAILEQRTGSMRLDGKHSRKDATKIRNIV